ncbi:MAG TPA: MFS transporter, partial [Flavisolibacter sp.]|nr:MFS transporter [Flavisolibacter sp.]
AVVWAFFWWRLVEDVPANAKWLTDEEKQALEERLLLEQKDIRPVKNYTEAFKSKTVVLLCLQYALWSIGVYGFVMWLPSILNAAKDANIVKTGWLSAVPYVLAIIGMITASFYSDKTLRRKSFIWPYLLVGALAFYASYLVGSSNFWLSFLLLVVAGGAMYAPYGPFFAFITEILPRNVAAGAIALINSFGALGSFAGSYVVGYLNGATGGFTASYLFMAGSLLLSALLTIAAGKETQRTDVNQLKTTVALR